MSLCVHVCAMARWHYCASSLMRNPLLIALCPSSPRPSSPPPGLPFTAFRCLSATFNALRENELQSFPFATINLPPTACGRADKHLHWDTPRTTQR